MGYLLGVTDFMHQDVLTHLSAVETRLSEVLARPRRIALGCIAALTGLGWLALALMMSGRFSGWAAWQALCQPKFAGTWGSFAAALPMWAAMTLAMMLPTAGPMILTYAEIADTAARKREPVVSPLVLTAGYVAVWLGFAVAAAALQWTLARAGLLDGGSISRLAGGAIFIVAGLYQFSALKRSCLTQCQRPFPFFFSNWTEERAGVFRLGLRQGLYCLGCCWAMMLVMFAVGTMNVVWMAALGVLMAVEKLSTTARLSQASGVAFVAIGSVMVLWSAV
jgi:predicted metal-binding membrane protein